MLITRVLKKIGKIFSKRQKIRIIELAILMLIGGLLEMCSVSLIIPFMNAMIDPESFMEKWYTQLACSIFNLSSERKLLMVLALVMVAIYIVKNAYLLFEYNTQYKFVYGNMLLMQRRMLDNYLARSYEFYLTADSGEVLRVINDDIKDSFTLLMTIITFLTETVVSAMLVVVIFVISPLVTLFMAVALIAIMLMITAFIKPVQRSSGKMRQRSLAEINKLLLQAIQGIKEIKVTKSEEYFKRKYAAKGGVYVNSIRKNLILLATPRLMIEALSMSIMFLVMTIMIYKGGNLESIIPIVSAIAVAAIRLLPATNRMSTAIGNISFLEPTLDKVIENLRDIDLSETGSVREHKVRQITSLDSVILMKNVTYKYPGTEKIVLEKAGMSISRGQSVGIIGASGAGKTTAVDLLLGLLEMNDGQVTVDGCDISDDIDGWYSIIGYIPQVIFLMDDTIRANIAFGYDDELIDNEIVWRVLREAALYEYVKELPDGINTVIGERGIRLSGGQRQRIGIARALYRNPQVLIFDEATSSLDNDTEAAIMEAIHSLHGQKTMIIIAHRLSTIEKCDCVFRVEDQKIIRER